MTLIKVNQNKSNYEFFNRELGVIRIDANKTEYFELNYRDALDIELNDFEDSTESECNILIEIEYNNPTESMVQKLQSKFYSLEF